MARAESRWRLHAWTLAWCTVLLSTLVFLNIVHKGWPVGMVATTEFLIEALLADVFIVGLLVALSGYQIERMCRVADRKMRVGDGLALVISLAGLIWLLVAGQPNRYWRHGMRLMVPFSLILASIGVCWFGLMNIVARTKLSRSEPDVESPAESGSLPGTRSYALGAVAVVILLFWPD